MQTQFSLTFGRNIGTNGHKVTDEQVSAFLRDTVSPRFPGFTVTRTEGYWEGNAEDSFRVDIVAEPSEQNRARVQFIAKRYCGRFRQEAVLLTETSCTMSLVGLGRMHDSQALEEALA